MDKDYFMNAGIPPLHLETSMPIPWSRDHSFFNPNSTMDHHFDSTWTSMLHSTTTTATSAAAATSYSNEAFTLRELIGRLGDTTAANPFPTNDRSSSSPILDQINLPNLGISPALAPPPLPALSADPGFAERAAKFSRFGSRSFNDRTSQLGRGSNPPSTAAETKLPRVSSTPSLKQNGPQLQAINGGVPVNSDKKFSTISNEESSVSDQIASGETASMNSRKRKTISKGKNLPKSVERDNDGNSKKSKPTENGENEKKAEEGNDENKTNQKPPEPPKDYIHVRARRGQATDSHSLAERVRREKISERMKLLQDLVPGCNKVTGKALMLDEIINYVQSLQRQVEFLSMKLASVNPALDFNVENLISKDMFQQNTTLPQQMYPLDSSAPAYYHHQNVQQHQLHRTNISSVDPPPFDGFTENLPQLPSFTEDDLHSIVQMGFLHKSANFSVQNQTSNMKVEL